MVQLAELEKKGSFFWMTVGCLFVVGIGVANLKAGAEFSFFLFYLIPIALVSWFSGRNLGLAISVVSAIMWFVTHLTDDNLFSQPFVLYWNTASRLGLFVVTALLIPRLKALGRERNALIDPLTGAGSRRQLLEAVETELHRSQRFRGPFTLVYIDIDGFKTVTDRFGSRVGDRLLRSTVNRVKNHLRKMDRLARLGGNEFGLLLTENDQDIALMTVSEIQFELLSEMRHNDWPISFSFGVLTYRDGIVTADELIGRAKDLMGSARQNGKDGIARAVYAS